jgi:hypothetical protein
MKISPIDKGKADDGHGKGCINGDGRVVVVMVKTV